MQQGAPRCRACDGVLIRRNRMLLFAVGLLLCAAPLAALLLTLLWIPALVLALAGAYLVTWGTLGKGLWCRQCKTFRIE